jgi:hypothetical protein
VDLILVPVTLLFHFIELSSLGLELDFKRQECLSELSFDTDQQPVELLLPSLDLCCGLLLQLSLPALQGMVLLIQDAHILESLTILLHRLIVFHKKLHSEFDIVHHFRCLSDIMTLMRAKQCTCLANVLLTTYADECSKFAML